MSLSLPDLYNMLYFMKQHGSYSLDECYSMIAFEFEIFYYMLLKDLKEQQEKQEQLKQQLAQR